MNATIADGQDATRYDGGRERKGGSMTNEEAIKFLSQIMDAILVSNSWLPSTDNPIKESFGMAIEALKAQPEIVRCKECVYADENYHCDYMTTWNYGDCFCSYGKRRTDE